MTLRNDRAALLSIQAALNVGMRPARRPCWRDRFSSPTKTEAAKVLPGPARPSRSGGRHAILCSVRKFNTEGPVVAERHYCIPPLERVDLAAVLGLIRDQRSFVLHAPRQTGKTSTLLALRDLLNTGTAGAFRCVYANVEVAQTAREDVGRAMRTVLGELANEAHLLGDEFLQDHWRGILETFSPDNALTTALTDWSLADPRPLVVLLDEVDALIGDSLIAVLRQLRAGYVRRLRGFPQSVVLCGVRDVHDSRIRSQSENAAIAGGSACNIRAESLRLGDFTEAQVRGLLAQHTAETGQAFTSEALTAVWTGTGGQPWLVNALCRRHSGGPRTSNRKPPDAPRPAGRQAPGSPGAPRDRTAAERGERDRVVHA